MKSTYLLRAGMPMLLVLCTCLALHADAVAQPEECGTSIPEGMTREDFMYSSPPNGENPEGSVPIRVAVHIVRYSNGRGGISDGQIESALNTLNAAFDPTLMLFNEFSRDYIDDDRYATIDQPGEEDVLREINVVGSSVNLYFVPECSFGWSGISSFTGSPVQGIVIVNSAAASSTTPHEFGHYFNLLHTHENYYGREHIARLGSCSNCSTAGDMLCDTPADYGLLDPELGYNVDPQCRFAPIKPRPDDGCGNRN
jgi:hypothetical protein